MTNKVHNTIIDIGGDSFTTEDVVAYDLDSAFLEPNQILFFMRFSQRRIVSLSDNLDAISRLLNMNTSIHEGVDVLYQHESVK